MDRDFVDCVFSSAVKTSFEFLLKSPFNFHIIDDKCSRIVYANDLTVIRVYYGRLSYHIDVELGVTTGEQGVLGLKQLLKVIGAIEANNLDSDDVCVNDRDIQAKVVKLAAIIEGVVAPLTYSDSSIVLKALRLKNEAVTAQYRDSSIAQARLLANWNWERGNYEQYSYLLTPYRALLDPQELIRLERAIEMGKDKS